MWFRALKPDPDGQPFSPSQGGLVRAEFGRCVRLVRAEFDALFRTEPPGNPAAEAEKPSPATCGWHRTLPGEEPGASSADSRPTAGCAGIG